MPEQPNPDQVIFSARQGLVAFADTVIDSTRFVADASPADVDRIASGSRIVPVSTVDNLLASIADHLRAWAEKTGVDAAEAVLRLSLFADYTLFRPVLEALASAIWILGPEESVERNKRAIVVANIELAKGNKYVDDLAAAGMPDLAMTASIAALQRDLTAACARLGLDSERLLARALDPSALTRKASQYVPGPTLELFRYWAICSAHAHAQLMTVLTHAQRTQGDGPHGDWTYAEASSENLAAVVKFIGKLLNVLVDLLNRRGFVLDRSLSPHPNSDGQGTS